MTGRQERGRARSPERQAIHRLLAEHGIRRYALFLMQQEGRLLPNGLETVSGFVLEGTAAVHSFWLSWDAARDAPTLAPFAPISEPETVFADDREYLAARRTLGL
ncbi:MAG: hypothetical protein IT306_28050 [Chloroflexi bacterium]|nr:hypothetical protein [Chloroflexota bacterium]